MITEDELFRRLSDIGTFTKSAASVLTNMLKTVKVPKGKLLLIEGERCEKLWFINSGLTHGYYSYTMKGNFIQITEWFAKENELFTCFESFINDVPAQQSIETLEPSELTYITRQDLNRLYDEHPEISGLARVLYEQYLLTSRQKLREMKLHSANDRLKDFYDHSRGLFLRAPQRFIASYLGITPNYVSRLKSAC
ncbi:Crp/Fnr family transcriptional regulator [Dyadobacter aurulentus]|uniref:Crp/Fnr family transcriptional regulator n=1 Tax=Dyadobacter sp. UC 10 TaxID=2605428 RepID=UPI0011F0C2D0|nr:Crp/Fnr family transcriptional regulator [Dyadobacter sp. UC 10]KAA0990476.1 Crp/Fnr family transcriptional regulator [Dyadobacter sp. UC 10]